MKFLADCYISPKGVYLCENLEFKLTEENWLKECYQQLELDYPKFYKMDNLSKMAFLATEIMKEDYRLIQELKDDEIELIFANKNASQHTDLKFIDSYTQQKNPSPSLFVYTLPNILTGELAIRNKWHGENAFFILPEFNSIFYTEKLFHSAQKGGNIALCGWVESKIDVKSNTKLEECFLFLVSLKNSDSTQKEIFAKELETKINRYRTI